MPYPVEMRRVDAVPLAVVRRRSPSGQLSKVVPEACGAVWSAVKALGVVGAGRHVAVYMDKRDGKFDMEIGVEVPAPFSGNGEMISSATPAGYVATAAHLGPYRTLGRTHEAIRYWCAAQNRTLAGPSWEIYGHWVKEWDSDPAKIRTEIFYLLKG
jgi:effector-binding domain-containing protein